VNCTSRDRSSDSREEETLRQTRHRVKEFLLYSDKYRLPFTHQQLKDRKGPEDILRARVICSQLEREQMPSMPFSAQYYDANEKPLYHYFGLRWDDDRVCLMLIWCLFMLTRNG
jgi:hypothetical protein